jgi:hypothetical protein
MTAVRPALLAAVATAVASLPASARPPADAAADVLARWAERRAVPVARYTVRWEWFPATKPGDPKPGEGGAYTGTGSATLDAADGRVRVDQDELLHLGNRRERLSRARHSSRHDGRELSMYLVIDNDAATAPVEPQVQHLSVEPWGRGWRWPGEFEPLLWGHGLIRVGADTPPAGWAVAAGRFVRDGQETIDGRPCVALRDSAARPGTAETIWADPGRGGAVVRHRRLSASGWAEEVTVTYRPTERGWLPAGWVNTSTKPGGPPVVTRRTTVEAVSFAPPSADEFRVTPPVGATVSTPGGRFLVAADGTWQPVERPSGLAADSRLGRWAAAVGWSGLAGLAAAVVLAGVLVWRKRRRTSGPAPAAA